jgi:rhamnogalacturonyl hydrolase YesR
VRELTFAGFLKQYVRSLSLYDTNGLYRLAAEAASHNPRLREPLFLYALFTGKEQVLLSATKTPELQREYAGLLERYARETMEQAMRENDFALPNGYAKVYRSYLSVKNGKQRDSYTKALMRNRIVRLQREKGISTYRVYTDLRLNHGNMNAFIKHGDCSKVSLEAARSAVSYLEQL